MSGIPEKIAGGAGKSRTGICEACRCAEKTEKRREERMITIREMQIDDLEQVMPIEEANFSIPWTETGFLHF